MQATTIDKESFLADIMAEVQAEEELDNTIKQRGPTIVESEDDEPKKQSFTQIDLKPPPGPDFFFDSMAEETQPSEASAKIKETLKKANKLSQAALAESRKMEEGEEDDNFIAVVAEEKEAPLTAEEKQAQFEELKRSLIVLKDKTGEELPPWLLNKERTEQILYAHDSSVALHYEILEFSDFLKPTLAEVRARDELIVIIESVVSQLWPEATVTVFGSYATDLFLPASDVDLCIMGTPENGSTGEFQQLADAVRNVEGFAKRVSVIDAKVKLVKIIAKKTNMDCDICIGAGNGPKYVPVIKGYIEKYPALRPLLLVVKCFLKQRNLNEVYSGGLGSYTLLLLVVSHLQMLRHNFPNSKANLGSVLHQFFKLYGRMFNICLASIRVKDDGGYMDKFERYKIEPNETIRYSIEDPNDVDNHLGANGYGAMRVRRTFANAAKTLAGWRRDDSSQAPTPLGSILTCEELLMRRRKDVILDLEHKGEVPLREELEIRTRYDQTNRSESSGYGSHSYGYGNNSSKMDLESYAGSSSRRHKRWSEGDSEYNKDNSNGSVNADEVNGRFSKRRRAGVNSYYGVDNSNYNNGYGNGNVGNSVMFNGNATFGYAPVYPVNNMMMMNDTMANGGGQYMRQDYNAENSFHPGSRINRRERHKPRRRNHRRER